MNNTHLDQAREWADDSSYQGDALSVAAARVIQSLPDHWIDAEKIEKLLTVWRSQLEECDHADGHTVMITCINDLAFEIATRSLPTLADMTPEEREACQWMQAKIHCSDNLEGVIFFLTEDRAKIVFRDGTSVTPNHEYITPLPDLPPMKWPGIHADTITAESVEDVQAGRVADFEPALPRPEGVPAGEPWIVEVRGRKWTGTRSDNPDRSFPWRLTRMDVEFDDYASDSQVTLMSRLVPGVKP